MELLYVNQTGEKLLLKQTKPYFLQRIDGPGNSRNSINIFKAPSQDGAFFLSGTLDVRNITIEGTILASSADELEIRRRNLLRIFSPKSSGTLVYKGKEIGCVVEEITLACSKMPSFLINLLCPSPFFEDLVMVRKELASWTESLTFPLHLTEEGVPFAVREPSLIVSVENTGDVPCGCTVEFKALGSVKNPELVHMETLEFLKINMTMVAGETISVSTHFASKRVESTIHGSAFPYLSLDSAFLQLQPGINILQYNAEENVELLEVRLYYKPLYLGV